MRILISILILCSPLISFSQDLNVNIYAIDGNSIIECDNSFIKDEKFLIEYKWSGTGNFSPPEFNGMEIVQEYPVRESSTGSFFQSRIVINGQVVEDINDDNREIIKTKRYVLKSSKNGRIKIPPAELNVESRKIKSSSIYLNICNCDTWNIYQGNPYIETIYNSDLFLSEQSSLITKIKYSKRDIYFRITEEPSRISINNAIRDPVPFSAKRKRSISKNCILSWSQIINHEILTPITTGVNIIEPAEIKANYFDFNVKKLKYNKNIKGKDIKINIKELPPKPENFYGTVSDKFDIVEEIDRTNLKTSEAISYKIIFKGEGNISMLEPFELTLPNSFEVFDPTITDKKYVGNNNTGGTKTFEYTLIPREKGEFKIPEIKFVYFNPKTKKYIELKTKEHLISEQIWR